MSLVADHLRAARTAAFLDTACLSPLLTGPWGCYHRQVPLAERYLPPDQLPAKVAPRMFSPSVVSLRWVEPREPTHLKLALRTAAPSPSSLRAQPLPASARD